MKNRTSFVSLTLRKLALRGCTPPEETGSAWGCGDHRPPVNSFGVSPKTLQVIKLASFRQKRVQNDVTPILQNPGTLLIPFRGGGFVPTGFHLDPDFITERVHLTCAGSGRDHEKIHDRCDAGQVEYHCILTAILFAHLGYVAGVFQTALQSIF